MNFDKVLYLKICIVAFDILLTILWRVWVRIKVTHNKYGHIFLGESILLESFEFDEIF
jgi:hypothetical protein